MQELILGILGAAGFLIAIRLFDKYNIDKHQKKLEVSSRDFAKIEAGLKGEQKQEDKETQRKVDEITKEQNNKPTSDKLADFFNRRK